MTTIIEAIQGMGAVPYDYTKIPNRSGYDLTLSMSENNGNTVLEQLRAGRRVAVVFNLGMARKVEYPTKFMRFPVVCGDDHDLTFLHRQGVVVGLRAKGQALKDTSGFVVHKGDSRVPKAEQWKLHTPFSSAYDSVPNISTQVKQALSFDKVDIRRSVQNAIEGNIPLLSKIDANPKSAKAKKYGYLNRILHLAPAREARIANLCPMSTEGCRNACLHTAGAVIYLPPKVAGRILRTWIFQLDREWFMAKLLHELKNSLDRARKHKLQLAVRLNGTSDIKWERIQV